MKTKIFITVIFLPLAIYTRQHNLPEIYQDVLVNGKVVQQGVRSCNDRYEAIKATLQTLPPQFKSLDIGASQGYFSFRMAEDFKARCTMIEDSYAISNSIWQTGDYLQYLCTKNSHLRNITLLQKTVFTKDLNLLGSLEEFDLVVAFSVIHHLRHDTGESNNTYLGTIDAILELAPVALIENPVNTGEHTQFIRKALLDRNGKLIYQSHRNTLLYEIYLFDRRTNHLKKDFLPDISTHTYRVFNGTYQNIEQGSTSKLHI